MTSDDYVQMMGDLNLSDVQKQRLMDLIELLMKKPRHYHVVNQAAARESGEQLSTLGHYYSGMTDGLNLAYKIFSGSLAATDAFDPPAMRETFDLSELPILESPPQRIESPLRDYIPLVSVADIDLAPASDMVHSNAPSEKGAPEGQ